MSDRRLELGRAREAAAYADARDPVVLVGTDDESKALASRLEIVEAYMDTTNGGEFKIRVRMK